MQYHSDSCCWQSNRVCCAGELVQQLASRMSDLGRQATVERLYIGARIPPLQVLAFLPYFQQQAD